MKLTFSTKAWEQYLYWQTPDKKILKRINLLIKDIQRTPQEGIGKPESLKHELSGYWSRRINDEHRIVYKHQTVKFDADSCKQGKPETVCSVVQIDDGIVISSGQAFEAHAPKSLLSNDDFTTFIKEFLIPNSHSKRYELTAKSCNSNDHPNISIENFSSVKWEGSITLGYFHEAYKNSDKFEWIKASKWPDSDSGNSVVLSRGGV